VPPLDAGSNHSKVIEVDDEEVCDKLSGNPGRVAAIICMSGEGELLPTAFLATTFRE
jgi:hypothetical protein